MDRKEILSRVDHTLLAQDATWEQVKVICDQGLACQTASVCIPPRYVKRAADYVGNRLKICTVIGFPNGYSTPEVKVFETEDAIRNGADEIDMVINIGWAKEGRWEDILGEIRAIKASCAGLGAYRYRCPKTSRGSLRHIAAPYASRNGVMPKEIFAFLRPTGSDIGCETHVSFRSRHVRLSPTW